MSPTGLSVSHVHHALLLQPAGVCGSRSFWISCSSHRGLETGEMVQPLTSPADPGGDAAASHQRANPTTPSTDCLLLWASISQARPEVTQKAPRSKAGKAQLAAASQKRGHDGGSKGIRLEDSSAEGEKFLFSFHFLLLCLQIKL